MVPKSSPSIAPDWLLYAIRAPNDEATIAINTSQFIGIVLDILFRRCLVAPFEWLRDRLGGDEPPRLLQYAAALLVLLLSGILLLALGATELISTIVDGKILPSLVKIYILLTVGIPMLVVGAVFSFVALVGPGILIPAHMVLAVALGWDVLLGRGLVEVECEPIPRGVTGAVSTINISRKDRSRLQLAHFTHATHSARVRVSEILKATTSRT